MTFEVIEGSGNIVRALEITLKAARAGEIDALSISVVEAKGCTGGRYAYRADAPFPWPRLLASIAAAHAQLLRDGL